MTYFRYPSDSGSFNRAILRCVGVGECRREHGGTMCPSYRVTREEAHSTRGRARMLFEMQKGEVIAGGWRDRHVREALDLCLACKGCKGDCPVNVDMATYKAEYLSHHYKRKLRPRQAYALGLIYWWARIASRAPALVNVLLHLPVVSWLMKRAAGIATKRSAPRFAHRTFVDWFRARPAARGADHATVVLWPDTFTNFFHPEVGRAAVDVLESLGFRVTIPRVSLCCGRPLYDYGMLPTAKRLLRRILDELREDILAGTPLIGLEPSCLAVFRDELTELFPNDMLASRLAKQSFTLSEFLMQRAPDAHLPDLGGRAALVQAHCHHRAVMGFDAERDVLDRLGVRADYPDSGCCGLAGSFGFEAGDKYGVSMQAGERVLFPAVRAADDRTLILADGFSCRTQIEQGTGRRAMHLAELIALGLRAEGDREAARRRLSSR
jgi:Fe-S oxidoreductase